MSTKPTLTMFVVRSLNPEIPAELQRQVDAYPIGFLSGPEDPMFAYLEGAVTQLANCLDMYEHFQIVTAPFDPKHVGMMPGHSIN